MTNKATKYGLMTIAAVLLVAMAFAGAGAAIGGTPVNLTENPTTLGSYQVLVVNDVTGAVEKLSAESLADDKNVYLLEDAEDWNAAVTKVSNDEEEYSTAVLILGDNLNFTDTASDYMMNYGFAGKIYGNGYVIENFTNTTGVQLRVPGDSADSKVSGFVMVAGDGLYMNYVQMTNSNVSRVGTPSTASCVGSLIGRISNVTCPSGVTVIGCYVFGGTDVYGLSNSGGIIGYISKNATAVVNHSVVVNHTVIGPGNVNGGLVGNIEMVRSCNINNCTVIDSWIESTKSVSIGGLLGGGAGLQADSISVKNCRVENCTVKAESYGVGGIIASCSNITLDHCDVINCNMTSNNSGYVGGLIGRGGCNNKPNTYVANSNVINCNITGASNNVGGLLGTVENNTILVKNCNVLNCNVIGSTSERTGGLVGGHNGIAETTATFKNCVAGTSVMPVYIYPFSVENKFNGTALVVITSECSANIIGTPIDLQFPTKEEIQVFPASKLPYVYVTYDAAPGVAGSPYSSAKQTVDMPYKRNTAFGSIVSGNSVSPIRLGYDLTDWDRAATGNVVSNEVVAAEWIIHEYNITYNNMTGATNPEANPATYNITSSTITLENAYKIGYTFENWYNSTAFGDASRNNTIPTGSTEDKGFYANWTVNTTDVTASDHKAEFHKDNITAIHSGSDIVVKVLLEEVSNVTDTAVNFTADNTSVGEIPGVAGYLKDEITIFDLNATAYGTAKINVTVTFANETIANATKDNIRFFHYNVSVWEPLNSTIASQNGAKVLYTVETTSFSPFGIGIYTPITYTVHFDANGGQGSMADMTFTYDEAPRALSANTFQRYNSNFLYWTTADDTRYTDKQFVQNLTTDNGTTVVMKAQWETYSTGGSSSGSTYMGSNSASYTPTQQPTVKPTVAPTAAPTEKPATPTVIATEKPTTQATQSSPAPFVGLLAGLGAAAVLLRMRK